MKKAHRHRFQVLTKQSGRLAEIAPSLDWTENISMEVTVESSAHTNRMDHLRNVDSAIRFLSLEPLLGPMPDLNLTRIDWVIVGGESGPKSRPLKKEWVTDIQKQCRRAGVPFFFKQWGGVNNNYKNV